MAGHGAHPAVLERLHHLTSCGRGAPDDVVGDGPAAVTGFLLALGDVAGRLEGPTKLPQRRRVGAPRFTVGPVELDADAHELPHLVDVGERRPVRATGCANPVEGAFALHPGIVHGSQSTSAGSPMPPPPDRRDADDCAEDGADPGDHQGRPEDHGAVTPTGGVSLRRGPPLWRVGNG